MGRYWYGYISGDETNPTNYALAPIQSPASFCVGGPDLCAIYAPANALTPTLPRVVSENIQQYIIAAKGLGTFFPLPPNKPYVYTRPSV
jgi:hypothetical protein